MRLLVLVLCAHLAEAEMGLYIAGGLGMEAALMAHVRKASGCVERLQQKIGTVIDKEAKLSFRAFLFFYNSVDENQSWKFW